jgi:hypothetical protein
MTQNFKYFRNFIGGQKGYSAKAIYQRIFKILEWLGDK